MGYSPVYSQAFITYAAATPNNAFAVPSGATAIIREFTAIQDIGGYDADLNIQDSEEAPYVLVWRLKDIGIATSADWQGRIVVPGGGIITVIASALGDTPFFYVGGYLLQNSIA